MNELTNLTEREKIFEVEAIIKAHPLGMGEDPFPLEHQFAKGLYIRKITVPANVLTVTKIHKFSHPAFLLQGEMSIMEEWGARRVKAPTYFITKAGTKRVIYHHTEVVLVTVHATEETDVNRIEDEIIADNFNEIDDAIDIQSFIEEVTV